MNQSRWSLPLVVLELIRLPARVLIVAGSVPPETSGAAIVLRRVLGLIDPRDYCLVRFVSTEQPIVAPSGESLASVVHRLGRPSLAPARRSRSPLMAARVVRRLAAEAYQRSMAISELLRSERCSALIVTTGGVPDLPAAALASRRVRAPLIIWMLDPWRHQCRVWLTNDALAMLAEDALVRRARAVIVTNETQRDVLQREHGVDAVVVHNPCDPGLASDAAASDEPWPTNPTAPTIVYTGQVYAAQADSVGRLVDALAAPSLQRWTFQIYGSTITQPAYIRGPRVVIHPPAGPDLIRRVQRQADILFLPLAFSSAPLGVLSTATPAKLGDYLAAQRPILVHAPPDTHLVRLARKLDFAEVVDVPAAERLAAAIDRLGHDAARRTAIVESAGRAAEDYSAATSAARFAAVVAGAVGAS